jgi:hypothetical protein
MPRSRYRYTFFDIPSQRKLGSLPLYGVSASDLLVYGGGSNAGILTGSIRMDSDFVSGPEEILDMTRPECTSVWMDRDDHPLWGGICWTRTYQSDGRVLQLNCQSFASYLASVVWDPLIAPTGGKFTLTDNPHNIVRYLYQYLQTEASPEYNVGIELEEYHNDAIDTMTQEFILADRKFLQEYASDAMKNDCEYRIRVLLDETGARIPLFESGRIGSLGVTAEAADIGPSYKYPGDISKYFLTNSSAAAPTRLFAIGRTQGADDITTVVQGPTANRIGIDKVVTFDTNSPTTLTTMANKDLADQGDLNRPVYEVQGENIDLDWAVGDRRRVIIDDPYRFPTRMGGVVRLVGWQFSPSQSDGNEQLAVTIDEVEQLVPLNV